jgi:hypothetical protein
MPIKQTIWGCEFGCHKKYVGKSRMVAHEARCFRNPARRACPTCFYDDQGYQCLALMDKEDGRHNVDCPKWRSRDDEPE